MEGLGGTTGGTAATDGCVNGGATLGIDAGPEGGARFIAGPDGSGTNAGGTGGGRSENIWAAAGVASVITSAQASADSRRASRPVRPTPLPPGIIVMLFTENAANSSLHTYQAAVEPTVNPSVGSGSRSRHNPPLRLAPPYLGINHACGTFWRDGVLANNLTFARSAECMPGGLIRGLLDPTIEGLRASDWSGAFCCSRRVRFARKMLWEISGAG